MPPPAQEDLHVTAGRGYRERLPTSGWTVPERSSREDPPTLNERTSRYWGGRAGIQNSKFKTQNSRQAPPPHAGPPTVVGRTHVFGGGLGGNSEFLIPNSEFLPTAWSAPWRSVRSPNRCHRGRSSAVARLESPWRGSLCTADPRPGALHRTSVRRRPRR